MSVVETRRPGRTRRTQAERTARTRRLLLDATVESLIEVGYSGTSTTEVARRAGVSRGAQTHHFPAKSDLVVAAIEHVFADRERAFRDAFDALPPHERTLEAALDILWAIVHGPTYSAILELIVAARTEPELAPVVHVVAAHFEEAVRHQLSDLFPDVVSTGMSDDLLGFVFAVLQGATISESVGFFGPASTTLQLLRGLARLEPETLASLMSTLSSNPQPGVDP